jgi:hypothetical protein
MKKTYGMEAYLTVGAGLLAAMVMALVPQTIEAQQPVTGAGAINYIPLWNSSSNLVDSMLYQTGGNVGIGMVAPRWALDVSGHINASVGYLIGESLVLTMPGGTSYQNIALGSGALLSNPTGADNTAIGYYAMSTNTGTGNTAVGANAMTLNGAANNNTAVGGGALYSNENGGGNTAVGANALFGVTNNNNTGIGWGAGEGVGGSNNIEIGFNVGAVADNNTIRIGNSNETSTFITGIYGESVITPNYLVCVDSAGKLGTGNCSNTPSSRRFKEQIKDMGDSSSKLLQLRPVTFVYKPEYDDGTHALQYGLIAEEVAKLYPEMVGYDKDGQPSSIKYQALAPMLLNELQRQNALQQEENRKLEDRLAALESLLSTQTAVARGQQ